MKSRALSLAVGAVIAVVLLMYLFSYKVRETETAVLLTFGRPQGATPEAGLHFRWPWPIQRVEKFDKRLNLFDTSFDETLTSDRQNIVMSLAVGWRIENPLVFYQRTGGSFEAAQSLIRQIVDHQSSIVGKYKLENFVSTDPSVMKFPQIEGEITKAVGDVAKATCGVTVPMVRIRRLELPQTPTNAVFARMKAERAKEASRFRSEGAGRASEIEAQARSEQTEILAKATADADRIRAEGDAEAAKYYVEFEKNPELAIFLRQIKAIRTILAERSTVVLDVRTVPFNLLTDRAVRIPTAEKPGKAADLQLPNKDETKAPASAQAAAKTGG